MDFGVTTLSHGGGADPGWNGAATGSSTALRDKTVVLAQEPGFEIKNTALSSPRAWGMAAPFGPDIYLFGGATDSGGTVYSTEVSKYSPATDAITSVATLTKGLYMSAAVTAPDNKIYLVKGYDNDIYFEGKVQQFDPVTLALNALTPSGMIAANRHTVVIQGSLLYIFGGYGTGPLRHEIQTYDVTTQKMATLTTNMTPVGGGRTRLQACGAPNGKIYIFGGSTSKTTGDNPVESNAVVADILEFTPSPDSLTKVASLPVPLMNVALGLLSDGKIYVVGGDTPTTPPSTQRSAAVYTFDPSTKQVEESQDVKLPVGLSGPAYAMGENGKLYLFGGRTDSGLNDAVIEMFPYHKTGTVLGPIQDTGGAGSLWLELDWQLAAPGNTQIQLAARTADKVFQQDDKTLAWQNITASPPVTANLPSGRYLQWRATLSTTNTANTPALRGVTIRYQRVK